METTLTLIERAREVHRGLHLSVSGVHSPYFQTADLRKIGTDRDTPISETMILNAIIDFYTEFADHIGVAVSFFDTSANFVENANISLAGIDLASSPKAFRDAAISTYLVGEGNTLGTIYSEADMNALPMYVSGVAKTGYFAVVGAPTVAGGAGVARFYIDSNGDGTGTAPSEVYSASLQAVIVNSTNSYVLTSVSVDTNRKYIDVTMKALTFSGITVVGIPVLGSQSLIAAANSTAVNCFVLVKK